MVLDGHAHVREASAKHCHELRKTVAVLGRTSRIVCYKIAGPGEHRRQDGARSSSIAATFPLPQISSSIRRWMALFCLREGRANTARGAAHFLLEHSTPP